MRGAAGAVLLSMGLLWTPPLPAAPFPPGPQAGREKKETPPGAAELLARFYRGKEETWLKGLWIPLKTKNPPGAYRLFLTPTGFARLQARVRGPQEWWVLGPKGAWKCAPGKTQPLQGASLRRLRLLARGLALLALWPLKDHPPLLPGSSPSEPRFRLGGGRKLRILLDGQGLPAKIFLSEPLGPKVRVLAALGASRKEEGPPWPARVVLQDDSGGPALEVELGQIQPCLLSNPAFFSPPGGGKETGSTLPGGFRPGAIKFTTEKPSRAVVLPDPGDGLRRRRLLVETGKSLVRAGLKLRGLPMFVNNRGRWEIWIPFSGGAPIPPNLAAKEIPGGLYASLFYQGPPHETLLRKVRHLEEELRKKGLRPAGPVQIGIFLLPGSLESLLEGEEILARIRVRVEGKGN